MRVVRGRLDQWAVIDWISELKVYRRDLQTDPLRRAKSLAPPVCTICGKRPIYVQNRPIKRPIK